jgi:hypothetical protein
MDPWMEPGEPRPVRTEEDEREDRERDAGERRPPMVERLMEEGASLAENASQGARRAMPWLVPALLAIAFVAVALTLVTLMVLEPGWI